VPTIPNLLRMFVALALIVGLGLAGICPCKGSDSQQAMYRTCGHGSHSCKCLSKTGKCFCGTECHGGSPAPKQDTEPALPTRLKELERLIAVVPEIVLIGDLIDGPSALGGTRARQARCDANLIAQGTRLNI
jgi:hypothetical protein